MVIVLAALGVFAWWYNRPSTPPTPEEAARVAAAAEHDRIRQAGYVLKGYAKDAFRDPDSVQFAHLEVSKDGLLLCGDANAKNGFGGFSGMHRFAYSRGAGLINDESADLPGLVDKVCSTPKYRPFTHIGIDW
jgi:hypothetical protein